MQKQILTAISSPATPDAGPWMNLEPMADVEVSSEDPAFPIENALLAGRTGGWRAGTGGEQTIRLRFLSPVSLRRIRLVFVEEEMPRTQELTLRWSTQHGDPREIVRQQFNFSSPHTRREVEEYQVELTEVSTLELTIVPDVSGGPARGSLAELRLA